MKKNVGLTYVKDFEFPSEQGFSGSAGKSPVKGYMRGGKVTAPNNASGKANAARSSAKPSVGAMQGGKVEVEVEISKNGNNDNGNMKKARGGTVGVTTERGPKSRRPKNTMTAAARGGSMHDKLYAEGGKMGYARGGQVKDTSGEFVQRSKAQDPMDYGTDPGVSRNQAEKEAGGRKRTKPKLAKGGGVHAVRDKPRKLKGMTVKGKMSKAEYAAALKASKKGMPKNVKGRGGLARYAEGGGVTAKDVPGTGLARQAAEAIETRERRTRRTVDEAISSQSRTQKPAPVRQVRDKPPKPKGKPPGKVYREDEDDVPTFTDVPKYAKRAGGGRVGKRGAAR